MGADLEPGLSGEATMIVGVDDTAIALGSGDVPVLGTPRIVALCEEATVASVARALSADVTTVGTRVELTHLRPTPVGGRATAAALLAEVEGRRLTFEVSVSDDGGTVAHGRVVRAVVDRARFLDSLS